MTKKEEKQLNSYKLEERNDKLFTGALRRPQSIPDLAESLNPDLSKQTRGCH